MRQIQNFNGTLMLLVIKDNMKKDKKYYGDTKLNHFCAFCGCPTETEDHVPSKCFLDKPHPQDLSVIPCCCKCNLLPLHPGIKLGYLVNGC